VSLPAPAAPPLLLVGGRYDPATDHAGAVALQAELGNGSHLVTYEGDGHSHVVHSPCVREVEQAFLIDPASPPSPTTCPAP
jgi:pimeloyl-ACP methyl ester carboxylesterase